MHRNMGAYMTPEVAYMQSLGLETLSIRYEKQASTCSELAKRLESLDGIEAVHYPGLEGNPYYEVSKAQFGDHPGAMLAFDLKSREHCFRFLNNLTKICGLPISLIIDRLFFTLQVLYMVVSRQSSENRWM